MEIRLSSVQWDKLPWETIVSGGLCLLLSRVRIMNAAAPLGAALCYALMREETVRSAAALGCALGGFLGAPLNITAAVLFLAGDLYAKKMGRRVSARYIDVLWMLAAVFGLLLCERTVYGFLVAAADAAMATVCARIFMFAGLGAHLLMERRAPSSMQLMALGMAACFLLPATAGWPVMGMDALLILSCAALMTLAACAPPPLCAAGGLMIGFCTVITGGADPALVGVLGVCALIAATCAPLGRLGTVLGFLLANAALTLYINGEATPLPLAEGLVGGALCALVPLPVLDTLSAFLRPEADVGAGMHAALQSRSAGQQLRALARAFKQTAITMGQGLPAEHPAGVAAEELLFAARTLKQRSHTVQTGRVFDRVAENEIRHAVTALGMKTAGVAVSKENGQQAVRIHLCECPGQAFCRQTLARIASRACGTAVYWAEDGCQKRERTGCTVAFFSRPPLCVQGAVSQARRRGERISGDVFASAVLPNGQEAYCLCDGMGSGEQAACVAKRAADTVLALLCAGVDAEQALRTADRALAVRGSEVFATADLVIIDRRKGLVRFYKAGAAPSVLLRHGRVETIEKGALPLGVLPGGMPGTAVLALEENDVILLMSDGISDAIGREDAGVWLSEALQQGTDGAAAAALVSRARAHMGEKQDDMTAVLIRIEKQEH